MAREDNLKPFQPGQSGNPGGRPKGSCSVTALMRGYLSDDETASKLAKAILSQAARGNGAAIKQVLDRTDGPVERKVEILIESRTVVEACMRAAARRMSHDVYFDWLKDLEEQLYAAGEQSLLMTLSLPATSQGNGE